MELFPLQLLCTLMVDCEAQDPSEAHLCDSTQSKLGGFWQILCMEGAGHDSQRAEECHPATR